MQVLVYWDPGHRAEVEQTVDMLGRVFEFSVDVLAVPGQSAPPSLPHVPESRVRRFAATGALEVDVARTCARRAYDLVITPPIDRPGWSRLLFGSRLGQLVHHAPATIWIARGGERLRRMVVGVAGGPQTEHDVRLAALLAEVYGAHVTLVHVLSQVPLVYARGMPRPPAGGDERLARIDPGVAAVRRAGELLAQAKVSYDLVVREGLVQDELLALSGGDHNRAPADLLVLGAHSRSVTAGLDYYEDIAELVARDAPVSTLVVHAESDWSRWSAVYNAERAEEERSRHG